MYIFFLNKLYLKWDLPPRGTRIVVHWLSFLQLPNEISLGLFIIYKRFWKSPISLLYSTIASRCPLQSPECECRSRQQTVNFTTSLFYPLSGLATNQIKLSLPFINPISPHAAPECQLHCSCVVSFCSRPLFFLSSVTFLFVLPSPFSWCDVWHSLLKVLERIILDRLGVYLDTSDNQFGFKAHYRTDLWIYALKEVVELYKRQHFTVIISFIDASKAFDRVNHQKLFSKLR